MSEATLSETTLSETTVSESTVSETIIRTDDGTFAMINVFEVDPERQKELAEVLSEGADKAIRHRPGCISVNIMTSLDGKRLVYYAQWRSKRDIKATMSDPDVQFYRDKAIEIGKPDPHAYTVYAVHHPDTAPETLPES
ncbi:antibiotic biosynthesis monooxygenase family protein [Streptomyces sp. NPDC050095]|uniref:antibiotic biosynthesis monooxygenase family protein n=1 Tax=unclassified Streptomyces TaxID=2593676 RepID=UPI00343594FC